MRDQSLGDIAFGRDLKQALRGASGVATLAAASMPFVFICYAHADMDIARALANELADRDIRVRWDRQFHAGVRIDDEIEKALETAAAVIVIWSEAARRSDYVLSEAAVALDRGVSVPVRVTGLEPRRVPFRYRVLNCCPVTDVDHIVASLRAKGL